MYGPATEGLLGLSRAIRRLRRGGSHERLLSALHRAPGFWIRSPLSWRWAHISWRGPTIPARLYVPAVEPNPGLGCIACIIPGALSSTGSGPVRVALEHFAGQFLASSRAWAAWTASTRAVCVGLRRIRRRETLVSLLAVLGDSHLHHVIGRRPRAVATRDRRCCSAYSSGLTSEGQQKVRSAALGADLVRSAT